jgi:hypothetical protein
VKVKPLSVVYTIRICLGVVAAAICVLLRLDDLLTSASLGIFIYIITYYFLRHFYINKVEKPTQIMTMGIGAYLLAFAAAFGLLFTLMIPTTVFTYTPPQGKTVIFNAEGSRDIFGHIESFDWAFGDGTTANTTGSYMTVTHTYADSGEYEVILTATDNEGYKGTSRQWVTIPSSEP